MGDRDDEGDTDDELPDVDDAELDDDDEDEEDEDESDDEVGKLTPDEAHDDENTGDDDALASSFLALKPSALNLLGHSLSWPIKFKSVCLLWSLCGCCCCDCCCSCDWWCGFVILSQGTLNF